MANTLNNVPPLSPPRELTFEKPESEAGCGFYHHDTFGVVRKGRVSTRIPPESHTPQVKRRPLTCRRKTSTAKKTKKTSWPRGNDQGQCQKSTTYAVVQEHIRLTVEDVAAEVVLLNGQNSTNV